MKIHYLILIVTSFFLHACTGEPFAIDHRSSEASEDRQFVYIVNHGWHTGIIIPAAPSNIVMTHLPERFKEASYYEFGWGDQGFYQAGDITAGLILRATLLPTDTVMHVVSIPDEPYKYFHSSEIDKIALTKNEINTLLVFIKSSFLLDQRQQVTELQRGLYGDSQFYQGAGTYHIFNTCNTWTAKGLRSAGLAININFKQTAQSIMSFLNKADSEKPFYSPH